ncbi:MAG: peptidase M64 [Fidelibacterota bacterium]|nr:MAG: peptidase M64 [Candidatus Neomarinimicrobiota bacterium]
MHRLMFLLIPCALAFSQSFDTYFTGQTLRFDYYHSGIATEEHISLDQVRLEGPWPGSRAHLVDGTNLGKYFFEVVDTTTRQVIYSRGFASIYGEWETTPEAGAGIWRSLHESQRFPEPKQPVRLLLYKRGEDGDFHPFYTTVVDPKSRFVDRSSITPRGKVWKVFESGPAATKVDILILGDGYTKKERRQFHKDVEHLVGTLFDTEPFKSRKSDFNVRAIDLAAVESGISNPRAGVWRDNLFGASFNSLDSDRYMLTYANRTMRDVASQAPYDALMIVANDRKYGGGGIFNLYATTAAHSSQAAYIFVHEFGHSFAGLGDEYYSSDVAYDEFYTADIEPWEPNITALLDPKQLKWWHLLDTDTRVPTPWNQAAYDSADYAYQEKRRKLRAEGASEETLEALFAEKKAITKPMLEAEPYFGKVGAFEGAGYQPKGLYRPEVDCIMFTRNPTNFCRVCADAIQRVIDLYAE